MDVSHRSSLKLIMCVAVLVAVLLVAVMLNSASVKKIKPKIKRSNSTLWLPRKWVGLDRDSSKNSSSTVLEADKGNLHTGYYSSVNKNEHSEFLSAGVVLSDNYADQVTNAVSNMMDLQCWAGQLSMSVVEPFLSGSVLKTGPTPTSLKFSSIFDKIYWNAFCEKHHFAPLVSWKHFLNLASRSVILAHVITVYDSDNNKPCAISPLKAKWSSLFRKYGFKVIKEVCIKMKKTGPLTTQQFNSLLFGIRSPQNVTLLFHCWRGIRREAPQKRITLKDTTCSATLTTNYTTSLERAKSEEDVILLPSQEILKHVKAYTERYLHNSVYIAVMLRMERFFIKHGVRDYSINITTCVTKIIFLWREMVQQSGVEATFLSTDVGQYGSSGVEMSKQVQEGTRKLFHTLTDSTLQKYDKTFAAVTGKSSKDKGYISVVQKTLASRAKCLLLVGGGSYQAHALHLYKHLHPTEQCVKIFDSRDQCV